MVGGRSNLDAQERSFALGGGRWQFIVNFWYRCSAVARESRDLADWLVWHCCFLPPKHRTEAEFVLMAVAFPGRCSFLQ